MIECEPLKAELSVCETDYITITREEYDDLVRKSARLSMVSAAIKADVLPSTLRRIARQEEGAYKFGSAIGNFFRAIGQGFADAQRPDRSVAEAAEAERHFEREAAD